MTHNKLTCLFGHHDYSDKVTVDKYGNPTHLCKICKKSGEYDYGWGLKTWTDYNEKGTTTHSKWSNGEEWWKANNGQWVEKKPKNWKYENV